MLFLYNADALGSSLKEGKLEGNIKFKGARSRKNQRDEKKNKFDQAKRNTSVRGERKTVRNITVESADL